MFTRVLLLTLLVIAACCMSVQATLPANIPVEVPDVLEFEKGAVVPLPPLQELLGLQVTQEDKTLTIARHGQTFTCTLFSTSAKANDTAITLPISPFARESVTYVPIRALIESLGGAIAIMEKPKRIQIMMPGMEETLSLPFQEMFYSYNEIYHALQIAEYRDTNEQLYVMNLDGTALKRLTYSFFRNTMPSFSADGSHWVYVRAVPPEQYGTLYSRSAATAQHQTILTADLNPNGDPIVCYDAAISADGRSVWYSTLSREGCALYCAFFAGGKAERVTVGVCPCITQDGKILVYNGFDDKQQQYIMLKDLVNNQEYKLAEGRMPRISPDGKTVLFYRVYSEENKNEDEGTPPSFCLVTCRIDGDLTTPVLHEANVKGERYFEDEPAFTPDGKRILFIRQVYNDGVENQGIFIMNADRSACKRLTEETDYSPVCSPDGKAIYFVRDHQYLLRMNMDGGEVTGIPCSLSNIQQIKFSPDGSKLFLLSKPQLVKNEEEN